MNAMLTINVRVVGRAAQAQLNQLANATSAVVTAGAKPAAKKTLGFFDALRGNKLLNAGKNLQWVGRQLTFNFTLPLVAAGVALTRFNLDVQRSMAEVKKVYGDATFTIDRVNEETEALGKSFQLLSTIFGVHQVAVVDIAAAWASAGSAGSGLAENVQGTLEAMVLGELSAEKATEGLIAIQATWGLSTKRNADHVSELSNALATLNQIENQTGIRFEGLIDVLVRAGGVAREGGATIQELAAMAAALVPATGSATQAGNALKTIFSRLMKPTKEITEGLKMLGIEAGSPDWMGKTITQKLSAIATEFDKLTQSQKNQVATMIAGRWQVNKFSVLMTDLNRKQGYFKKAMEASTEEVRNNKKYQDELMTVLKSNPKRWDIMTNAIRNSLGDAFLPMIPIILRIIGVFAQLAIWFSNLPDGIQLLILLGLGLLALAGPMLTMIAMTQQLIGLYQIFSRGLAKAILKVIIPALRKGTLAFVNFVVQWVLGWIVCHAATLGWILLIIGAIVLLILALTVWRDDIGEMLSEVGELFGVLFKDIQHIIGSMVAVLDNAFGGVFDSVVASLVRFASTVRDTIGRAIDVFFFLPQQVGRAMNALYMILVRAIHNIISAIGLRLSNWVEGVRHFLEEIGTLFSNLPGQIVSATRAIAQGVSQFVNEFIGMLATLGRGVQRGLGVIVEGFSRLPGAILQGLGDIGQIIGQIVLGAVRVWVGGLEAMARGTFNILSAIGRGFGQLPRLIGTALLAVLSVVRQIVTAIWNWLSYLNPFARHSPSLVDQVKLGMTTILDQYARLAYIPRIISGALAAMANFAAVNKKMIDSFRHAELMELRNQVVNSGGNAGATDAMVRSIEDLEATLPGLTAEIARQTAVVARWEAELSAADAVLEEAERRLSAAEKAFDAVADQMETARDRINDLANTPLAGMRAMEDQIFANEMAQNQLNLALLEYEKAGQSLDSIRDKFEGLNGELELLRGEQKGLRLAGAGGDVLGVYEDQIKAIEDQRDELKGTERAIIDINKQLDELDLERRFLDLTKSITFDPLLRQIDQMVNTVDEMSFDEIVNSIREQQALIAQLQPQYDALADTVERETAAVDAAKAARDAIATQLDEEQSRLDALKDAYSEIEGLIRDMEDAMRGFAEAAEKAKKAAKGAGGGAGAGDGGLGGGADFPVAGGDSMLGPEGMLADIEAFNKDLEKRLQEIFGGMGLKIKEAFSRAWNAFVGWLGRTWDSFTAWWTRTVGDAIANLWRNIGNWGETGVKAVADFFRGLGESFMVGVQWFWETIQDGWDIIMFGLQPLIDTFTAAWRIFGDDIGNIIGGAWDIVVGIFKTYYSIIENGLGIFINLFTLDWGGAWDNIKEMTSDIWDGITGVIGGALSIITGLLGGTWEIIKGAVKLAWDKVYGFISEPIGNIVEDIQGLGGKIIGPLQTAWDTIKTAAKLAWEAIEDYIIDPIQRAVDFIGGVPGQIRGFFNDIYDTMFGFAMQIFYAIRDGMAGVGDAIMSPIRTAVRWVIDRVNGLIDVWNGLSFTIGGWELFGQKLPSITVSTWPKLGHVGYPFHEGGVVPGLNGTEQLALLQAGEIVFQPDQLAAFARGAAMIGSKAAMEKGKDKETSGLVPFKTDYTTNIHIHGDLSFPNITNPEDAHEFIQNLKAMVE